MLGAIAAWLSDPSGLTPHGFCLFWEPGLIQTHAVADVGIGMAHFTIPLALTVLVRQRRNLALRPVFWLFAAFILRCGTALVHGGAWVRVGAGERLVIRRRARLVAVRGWPSGSARAPR